MFTVKNKYPFPPIPMMQRIFCTLAIAAGLGLGIPVCM